MAKTVKKGRAEKASTAKYEVVFESKSVLPTLSTLVAGLKRSATPSLSGLVGELKSLGERGGGALGDVYARAASTVLDRIERFEDRTAERRYRQRAKSRPKLEAVPTGKGSG